MGEPRESHAYGLRKRFGRVHLLEGVSFEVDPGTVFGLLGPNGAGTTTAVRIRTTLVAQMRGRRGSPGRNVVREPVSGAEVHRSGGSVRRVEEHLTGRENLEMIGRLSDLRRAHARRSATQLLGRFWIATIFTPDKGAEGGRSMPVAAESFGGVGGASPRAGRLGVPR